MPWTFPLGLVSGVLMSECASIQSTPPGPCADASPPSVPSATEWSPPSTSGIVAGGRRLRDELRGDPLARRLDLREEARTLVLQRRRLRQRRLSTFPWSRTS